MYRQSYLDDGVKTWVNETHIRDANTFGERVDRYVCSLDDIVKAYQRYFNGGFYDNDVENGLTDNYLCIEFWYGTYAESGEDSDVGMINIYKDGRWEDCISCILEDMFIIDVDYNPS